jgi:hypothetical protein
MAKRPTIKKQTKRWGHEVRVGDILVVSGYSHRIVEIEPYTHPTIGKTCGIARASDGWEITLMPTICLEVA